MPRLRHWESPQSQPPSVPHQPQASSQQYLGSRDFRVILDDQEKTLASALMEVQPLTLRPDSACRPPFSSRSYTESLHDYLEESLDVLGCAGWHVVVVGVARMDDKVHFGMVTFSAIRGNRVQVLLFVG